jgi:hypothetical protein
VGHSRSAYRACAQRQGHITSPRSGLAASGAPVVSEYLAEPVARRTYPVFRPPGGSTATARPVAPGTGPGRPRALHKRSGELATHNFHRNAHMRELALARTEPPFAPPSRSLVTFLSRLSVAFSRQKQLPEKRDGWSTYSCRHSPAAGHTSASSLARPSAVRPDGARDPVGQVRAPHLRAGQPMGPTGFDPVFSVRHALS